MAAEVCVGLGEILWDEFVENGKIVRHLGGAPSNFAFHARALGARGEVISSVGEDELGYAILGLLGQKGFHSTTVSIDPAHPTGRVTVEHIPHKPPRYTIEENAAWDYLPMNDAAAALCGQVDAVCFGSLAQRSPLSRDTIRRLLSGTRRDTLRVFDVNLRQHYYTTEVLETSFTLATVAKISDEELPKLAKLLDLPEDPVPFAKALLKRYHLRLAAITRGNRGSLLVTPDLVDEHSGIATSVVDTVGAGDSFTASLAIGLLRALPLAEINQAANRIAAHVCGQAGATPALPAELVSLLDG